MLDYTAAVNQSTKEESISLAKENLAAHLILVKIKE